MNISLEIILAVAGMVGFYSAGDFDARHGETHHGILWAGLSALASGIVFVVFGGGWISWLIAQVCVFVGIGVVRVWLEDWSNKQE